jgi:RNA polymerase sigma-70 factor (ECF subfamily)
VSRDEILASLRERILAFAASRIGKDKAEDLAQDVLVLLERKYAHVTAPEELLPLALEILRFKIRGEVRKSLRRGEYSQAAVEDIRLADPGEDPESYAERRELEARLAAALARLDGRCRELFRMKLDGMSFEEIRREFQAKAINTVYTWDFRCRKRLLDLLGGSWERKS